MRESLSHTLHCILVREKCRGMVRAPARRRREREAEGVIHDEGISLP